MRTRRFLTLAIWAVGAVTAGAAEKPPLRYTPMGVSNGCFVESIAFCDNLRETFGADTWYRVLQWGAKEDEEIVAGHAVAVFEQRGKLWCWDINRGFFSLAVEPAQRDAVETVAAPILARYSRVSTRFPGYRFDTTESPDPAPPTESAALAQTDPVLRDALLVGARLGKHRPVCVVQFTLNENGATRQCAATAFAYFGRFCVYFPERGTVPYRSHNLAVKNFKVLREALRKQYPNLKTVQPLP